MHAMVSSASQALSDQSMVTLCQIMQRHPHGPSLLDSQIPTLDCSLVRLSYMCPA